MSVQNSLRIAFCWRGTSGYMAACWRELTAMHDVEVKVWAKEHRSRYQFNKSTMDGIDWIPLPNSGREAEKVDLSEVFEFQPHAIVICGWGAPVFRQFIGYKAAGRKTPPLFLAMDTPWRGDSRQKLASIVLAPILKRTFSGAITAGGRSATYASKLGFADSEIHQRMYGYDHHEMVREGSNRKLSLWPKSFVFFGRVAEEKGIEDLVSGYALYRSEASEPWPMHVYGSGPLEALLNGVPGVKFHGFVQPSDIRDSLGRHGCYVMPSRYEPWGVSLAEAAALGLPLLASDAVGASDEILMDGLNGYLFRAEAPKDIANKLHMAQANYDSLPQMGERSSDIAARYSAVRWATEMRRYLERALS